MQADPRCWGTGWDDVPELTQPVRDSIIQEAEAISAAWSKMLIASEVVLIALEVDDLERPAQIRSSMVRRPTRKLIADSDPQSEEILTSFDLALASGRWPLVIFLYTGELAKSLVVGLSSRSTGEG